MPVRAPGIREQAGEATRDGVHVSGGNDPRREVKTVMYARKYVSETPAFAALQSLGARWCSNRRLR